MVEFSKLVAEFVVFKSADDTKISGSVDGLSKILYTDGSSDIAQVFHNPSASTIVLKSGDLA